MPKKIVNLTLERTSNSHPWGFVVIGGKDQSLTVKVGAIRPGSPAENANLRSGDFIWQINGKEVFEMTHQQCVDEIKKAGGMLRLATERGDHIVPNFEEIWPSKKKQEEARLRKENNLEYYIDAMNNGYTSGHLPIPSNFTTVGRPHMYVNQYDSPLECYSHDTLDDMLDERLTMMNPDVQERVNRRKMEAAHARHGAKKFDTSKSNVIAFVGREDRIRCQ